MKTFIKLIALFAVTGLTTLAVGVHADPVSTEPVPRTQQFSWMSLSDWYQRHAADVALAEKGEANIVFLGDSITQGWSHQLWQEHFAPRGAVNFAIGGDLTQNVLWRLNHGNVEKLDPALVVLLVGVNNYLHNRATPEDTFAGVQAVLNTALAAYPNARVIVQGVFPFGEQPDTPERQWVEQTNQRVKTLADNNPRVDYYDFGSVFLQDDGRISKDIMPDHLHPGPQGYALWLDKLLPVVKAALGERE